MHAHASLEVQTKCSAWILDIVYFNTFDLPTILDFHLQIKNVLLSKNLKSRPIKNEKINFQAFFECTQS